MAIAIIGAGMAALSAARALVNAGKQVRLFDKGRGPGGRMSTRRANIDGQEVRFDHGAQYLTAQSDAFQSVLEDWEDAGIVAEWSASVVDLDTLGQVRPRPMKKRYVGIPGMNGIIRHLAAELDVRWGARVTHLQKMTAQWQLTFEDGDAQDGFEAIILAIPAEQVPPLTFQTAPEIAIAAEHVRSNPCWTTMVAFKDTVPTNWDAAKSDNGAAAWMARNSSKPQRSGLETWVLQASADWSRVHLEQEKEAIAEAMLKAFRELSGAGEALFTTAHRWRYSQIQSPAPHLCYWIPQDQIGACGDWLSGPRVEDAWKSGCALALQILKA